MKITSQELELRNIMDGLEEFATFMSYQSDYAGLRILSVETLEQDQLRHTQSSKSKAEVIPLKRVKKPIHQISTSFHKALKFYDQKVH